MLLEALSYITVCIITLGWIITLGYELFNKIMELKHKKNENKGES